MEKDEKLLTLKSEVETLGEKLAELSSEELEFVTGGQSFIGMLGQKLKLNKDGGIRCAPGRDDLMGSVQGTDNDEMFVC